MIYLGIVAAGLVVWTLLALLIGIGLGRGIRAADRADERANWIIPPTWGEKSDGPRRR